MKELSTDIVTHKLVIAGIGTKYITKSFAENIFAQLNNKDQKVIIISNPDTLTYYQKYKGEIELLPLDGESKSFEDMIYMSGLSETKKGEVREILEIRKQENKKTTIENLKNIIESFK